MLLGKRKVVGGHDVFALDPTGAPVAQLGGDIIEIGIAECHRNSLFQIGQHIPEGIPGPNLGIGLICHRRAVHIRVPVVDPTHIILIGGQRYGTESGDLAQGLPQGNSRLGRTTLPRLKLIPVTPANPPHQRSGRGSGFAVGQGSIGRSGLTENITIAGGIDHHLGHDCLPAFLGLKDHTLDGIAFHNGAAAPSVVHYPYRILVLQQHLVHFDLQLVGLEIHRSNQARRLGPFIPTSADAVMNGLPTVDKHRIAGTDLLYGGRTNSAWNGAQASIPLLLKAANKALIIPG